MNDEKVVLTVMHKVQLINDLRSHCLASYQRRHPSLCYAWPEALQQASIDYTSTSKE
jgi:hypothetical protein